MGANLRRHLDSYSDPVKKTRWISWSMYKMDARHTSLFSLSSQSRTSQILTPRTHPGRFIPSQSLNMKFAVSQTILLLLAPLALALPTGGASSTITPKGYTAPGNNCREFRGQMICARDDAAPTNVGKRGYTAPGSNCREFRGQMICARDEAAPAEADKRGYTVPGSNCKEFRGQMICS
ncbi:hypothetical protein F5144DRAFT_582504 [Chaetomium tenue]|uniref:Uncharacterized protein n=1 Tax=Chaetomium tenue TaxID=1854479 RepID=A0ACB7NXH8_9PEZI|nr:hypothetical protein F5144DRAFT_582504 [Chaetomium globosum]